MHNRNTNYARSRSSEEPRRSHSAAMQIAAPKPDLGAKAKKIRFWSTFSRDIKRKIISAKTQKHLVPKDHSQPSCSHEDTIYDSQLQKAIL
jgi:hypothetical protein